MSELILKKHGAHAHGLVSYQSDGTWIGSLLVRDLNKEIEQNRGPEPFRTETDAKNWVLKQAQFHGFGPSDFDLQVENE
ncbi:MAG: hypothetical protein H7316_10475 [Tardiphaga sp.]|uniref:hypothetical protein n=1 Tax=Tardiphaga sp. TaxID=1926292 RepID=UPI0019B57DF9|nr:hypothetical protein [Tardiphaga sp.]MBC7584161.1 hypothetical protein [Tardiphaga sp.]